MTNEVVVNSDQEFVSPELLQKWRDDRDRLDALIKSATGVKNAENRVITKITELKPYLLGVLLALALALMLVEFAKFITPRPAGTAAQPHSEIIPRAMTDEERKDRLNEDLERQSPELALVSYEDLQRASHCARKSVMGIIKDTDAPMSYYGLQLAEAGCNGVPILREPRVLTQKEKMALMRQRAALGNSQ